MRCTMNGCPGEYEVRQVDHLERWSGQSVVIVRVAAEVCPICGDTSFSPATTRHVETRQRATPAPSGFAPRYDYVDVELHAALNARAS